MSITFCIEAHSPDEDHALRAEGAPELNVHNVGAFDLLRQVGIVPDHTGTIDPGDLIRRIDHAHPYGPYAIDRLPRLRRVAVAAQRLGRQVVWG